MKHSGVVGSFVATCHPRASLFISKVSVASISGLNVAIRDTAPDLESYADVVVTVKVLDKIRPWALYPLVSILWFLSTFSRTTTRSLSLLSACHGANHWSHSSSLPFLAIKAVKLPGYFGTSTGRTAGFGAGTEGDCPRRYSPGSSWVFERRRHSPTQPVSRRTQLRPEALRHRLVDTVYLLRRCHTTHPGRWFITLALSPRSTQ